MKDTTIESIWGAGKVLSGSLSEYREGMRSVYLHLEHIIRTPESTPPEFSIGMDALPEDFFAARRNIFSTLFQASYRLLKINKQRRLLYAKLNLLFRIWVTSADNLLDNENKIVVPIRIAPCAHIMPQIISIMAADRVLKELLDEAVADNIITLEESSLLATSSLQIILPSAAEEAQEETGIKNRPDPEYVLNTIHRMKTAILFHIPFLGPESIEHSINPETLNQMKIAYDKIGLGCQLLDDIRDIARDYLEKKHNYILSQIFFHNHIAYINRVEQLQDIEEADNKIYSQFPEVVLPASSLAQSLLREGLFSLNSLGLNISSGIVDLMIRSLVNVLDVKELPDC